MTFRPEIFSSASSLSSFRQMHSLGSAKRAFEWKSCIGVSPIAALAVQYHQACTGIEPGSPRAADEVDLGP